MVATANEVLQILEMIPCVPANIGLMGLIASEQPKKEFRIWDRRHPGLQAKHASIATQGPHQRQWLERDQQQVADCVDSAALNGNRVT